MTIALNPAGETSTAALVMGNRASQGTSKLPLWIRTVAGPAIGFGHLRRSLTLGRLLSDDFRPVFLFDPRDQWTREQAIARNWRFVTFNNEGIWRREILPAALLVDTRESRGLLQMITEARRHGVPVISIHDLGLNPLPSDLVVDGSVLPVAYHTAWRYTKFCYGTSYMVLDPAFTPLHEKKKHLKKRISRVVVNLGGGDSREHYPKVLRGLRDWNHNMEVTGIPGFTNWGQLHLEQLDWRPLRFRWARSDEPVHELLFGADAAITAGGLSAFEALCVGTPLLAVAFDELQQVTLTTLAKANACIDLGLAARLEPEKLVDALSALEADVALRQSLSECGREIVDGRGAERVAELIRRLANERLNQAAGRRPA